MKHPPAFIQRAQDVWAGFFVGFIIGGAAVVAVYEFGGVWCR